MEISSIFESWFIGDGTYPPLTVGDEVNLSFEVQFSNIKKTDDQALKFNHLALAEYEINAKILRQYNDGNPLYLFDAGLLKFYRIQLTSLGLLKVILLREKEPYCLITTFG